MSFLFSNLAVKINFMKSYQKRWVPHWGRQCECFPWQQQQLSALMSSSQYTVRPMPKNKAYPPKTYWNWFLITLCTLSTIRLLSFFFLLRLQNFYFRFWPNFLGQSRLYVLLWTDPRKCPPSSTKTAPPFLCSSSSWLLLLWCFFFSNRFDDFLCVCFACA